MTRRPTPSIGAESAGTSIGSQLLRQPSKARYLLLREMLREGSWNPFQRADGALLEKINRDMERERKKLTTYEDAPL